MSLEVIFSNGFFVLTAEGECHPEEVEKSLLSIAENPRTDKLLVDARRVTNTATTREVHEYVNIHKFAPFNRIALVVDNPAHFSMAKMFSLYNETYNKQKVAVFNDIDEATNWLTQ